MPTPQEESLNLAHQALPFAVQMIGEHDGFLPYGYALMTDGGVQMFGGHTGAERVSSNKIANRIKGAFKAKASEGSVRATALAQDAVYTPPGGVKGNAIAIQISHAEHGYGVTYIWPYMKADGQVQLSTGFPQPSANDIFLASQQLSPAGLGIGRKNCEVVREEGA